MFSSSELLMQQQYGAQVKRNDVMPYPLYVYVYLDCIDNLKTTHDDVAVQCATSAATATIKRKNQNFLPSPILWIGKCLPFSSLVIRHLSIPFHSVSFLLSTDDDRGVAAFKGRPSS